jgi:hypothetical protein
LARRRYQKGMVLLNQARQVWRGRYRKDIIQADGSTVRNRPQIVLGTKKELPTQRLAVRKMDEFLSRINDCSHQPIRIATVEQFAKRFRAEVLSKRKPSTVRSAGSHFEAHILPQLGKLRLDQIGPENQQVFINSLEGASRKTVLNVLSTLSAMLSTAKNWGYAAREVELKKLVLPDRNSYVAPHFTRSQVESIFSLAQEPWRTFFVVLAMTGMRAGEALGLQWTDIDFEHSCIHIRRSAWYGKIQSTKSKTRSAPITLPERLQLFCVSTGRNGNLMRKGFCSPRGTVARRRAIRSWNTSFGRSSTLSTFPAVGSMRSVTASPASSSTPGTRRKSRSSSSATQMRAQRSDTFISAAGSQSRRWRTFQIL